METQIKRTAAHYFSTPENITFDCYEYSKMKFGDVNASKKCGYELGLAFIKYMEENPIDKLITISPSPYYEIPKASFYIYKSFLSTVNRYFFNNKKHPLISTNITNRSVHLTDYAKLTPEERLDLIGNGNLYFNTSLIKDTYFLILDDILITGGLEKTILKRIKEQKINEICDLHFLYYAQNTSPELPASFEDKLNFCYMTDYYKFIELLKNGATWNMRNIKFVLDLNEQDLYNFLKIMENHKPNFTNDFFDIIIASNCIVVEKYHPSIKFIQNFIQN